MRWIFVVLTVLAGTVGDVFSAKGMASGGELRDFGPAGIARILRYIVSERYVIIGIIGNAVAFGSFLALLSVSELSFAVPATSLAYIMKVGIAKWYLHERVTWHRWAGAVLVAIGVTMIVF